jgi:hypothetical protein
MEAEIQKFILRREHLTSIALPRRERPCPVKNRFRGQLHAEADIEAKMQLHGRPARMS